MKYKSPFDSPSFPTPRNTQHRETLAVVFFAIRRTRTSHANKTTKVNCLTDSEKVNNKEEIQDTQRNEDYMSFNFLFTSCLLVVTMSSYPRLVPVCSRWRQLENREGEGHWGRGCSFLKYTASGKCNYKPEEGQSLI